MTSKVPFAAATSMFRQLEPDKAKCSWMKIFWNVSKSGCKRDPFIYTIASAALYATPICVSESSKITLSMAIWNDSLFLSSLHVMDYSLLVGVDEKNNELVVGIIGR